jgi:hypothetical protein
VRSLHRRQHLRLPHHQAVSAPSRAQPVRWNASSSGGSFLRPMSAIGR